MEPRGAWRAVWRQVAAAEAGNQVEMPAAWDSEDLIFPLGLCQVYHFLLLFFCIGSHSLYQNPKLIFLMPRCSPFVQLDCCRQKSPNSVPVVVMCLPPSSVLSGDPLKSRGAGVTEARPGLQTCLVIVM